jgi:SAM-dependent methyltransferase
MFGLHSMLRNTGGLPPGDRSTSEEGVSEWDALAGEWDDMAAGYTKCFIRHCVRHNLLPIAGSEKGTIIRIVDFGCKTGLFMEHLIAYYKKIAPSAFSLQVIAMDASTAMIRIVQEKIRNYEWNNNDDSNKINVTAICTRLHALPPQPEDSEVRALLYEWQGTVDLVVASSVLTYLPTTAHSSTMMELSKLLKPHVGRFIHSDWSIRSDSSVVEDTIPVPLHEAASLYAMGHLRMVSTEIVQWNIPYCNGQPVLTGVAIRDEEEA